MPLNYDFEHYTVQDYLRWPDEIRCELIDGVIYDMTPAPVLDHQRLLGQFYLKLSQIVSGKRSGGGDGQNCEVLVAPVDVVLAEDTVVQPDLVVVCDPDKLANGKYVDGAPDLVIEVLSPSTALKDRREKRHLYEKSGVKEYLLIDPEEHYAEYFRLEDGDYGPSELLGPEDSLALVLFPTLSQTLAEMFGWEVPEPPKISV